MNKRRAYFPSALATREEEGARWIEGYFAVFSQETELWSGCYEQIAPGAFDNSLRGNDIRCLFNHEAGNVLGRTGSGTLELRTDAHGLWGRVRVNTEDSLARDVYARVARGDISGCSFAFDPVREDYEEREDGLHWTVREADTAEVSVCTFPAYPQTEIQARQRDFRETEGRRLEQRRTALKKRLEEIKC